MKQEKKKFYRDYRDPSNLKKFTCFDYCLLAFVCLFAAGAFMLIWKFGRCLKCQEENEAAVPAEF